MNNRPEDRLEAAFGAARAAAGRVPTAEQQANARAQFLAEAKAVSLDGDMRLRDQTGALSDLTLLEGDQRMKRIYIRRARLIAAVLLGVIIGGGFWATPSLRAFAQSVFSFFTPAGSDAVATLVPVDGGPRQLAADANPYSLTLDDVTAQVDFARVPTSLPDGYQFDGAEYRADQQTLYLNYVCDRMWWLTLIEERSDTPMTPVEVGASAKIEDVPIRDTVGQYVRGAWEAMINQIGTAEPSAEGPVVSVPRVWTAVTDWQHLVWREDGINFTLASGGSIGRIDAPPTCALDKDSFAATALSVQPASAQ